MEVEWTIEDGYVNNGPHTLEIDDEDIRECDSIEEAMKLIDERVQSDFRQNVYATYSSATAKEAAKAILESKESEPVED